MVVLLEIHNFYWEMWAHVIGAVGLTKVQVKSSNYKS